MFVDLFHFCLLWPTPDGPWFQRWRAAAPPWTPVTAGGWCSRPACGPGSLACRSTARTCAAAPWWLRMPSWATPRASPCKSACCVCLDDEAVRRVFCVCCSLCFIRAQPCINPFFQSYFDWILHFTKYKQGEHNSHLTTIIPLPLLSLNG